MKGMLFLLILICSGSLNAAIIDGFTGAYSPSNWTITSGSLNSSSIEGDPRAEFIVDNASSSSVGLQINNVSQTAFSFDAFLEYETIAVGTGTISFDLIMATTFRPFGAFSPRLTFFTTLNDNIFDITDTVVDDNELFTHLEIPVISGQSFGFRFETRGVQQGVQTEAFITGFRAPVTPVPEPNLLLLITLGIATLSISRHRLNQPNEIVA